MNFEYSEIQISLQDSLLKYFLKNYTFEKRQNFASQVSGFCDDAWKHYAEMGLLALTFPEQYGGLIDSWVPQVQALTTETSGALGQASNVGGPHIANTVDIAVDNMWVMECFGKTLCLEPYLSTVVMAGGALLHYGTEQQKSTLIPKIAIGELKIAIAYQEPESRYDTHCVSTLATLSELNLSGKKQWRVNGKKCVVLNANSADHIIVTARTSGDALDQSGISLFLIPTNAAGLSVMSYKTHDGSRASDIELKDVVVNEENLISVQGNGFRVLEDILGWTNAALCAEAVGIMSKICDLTLEYLKTRKQFGVPIGKFQALQHRMADMITSTEQARSMAILAVKAQSEVDLVKRQRDISAAKAYICRSGKEVGQEAIQLHGGMGVTHEMSVAHYFKRLTLITQTFGDFNYHISKVGEYLLMDLQ